MLRLPVFVLVIAAALAGGPPAHAQGLPAPGIEELYRLDALPAFKRSAKVGSFSSYDRTGGNDDGFSGKHSFIRKEPGGLVIAEMKGPGVIYRIWTPTPTDDVVEFYFDGEATPRIRLPFRDLFTGKQAPFLTPVVGTGAGGFYSYLPLPYAQSCKVVVKAENLMFYQINYATYPAGSKIESYAATPSKEFQTHLERARALLAASGSDVSSHTTAAGDKLQIHKFSQALAPGATVTLFESNQPGRIAGIRLGPARAFAGKERDILIRVYWDGEARPAVNCPVGDFFGYSWGDPAVKSLLLGTADNTNYVYLPMPYDKSAKIELVSERASGPAVEVQAEVRYANIGRSKDEGKLYALWRRENLTVEGRPFTFLETKGRGHAVGFILQAQGTQSGAVPEYFEGDDQTTIDGELVIHGTGSEDFFNGGWYDVPGRWETRVSLPLSGCLDFKRHLGRTGGYRFLITDAYAYGQSILSTIEHGPTGNKFPTDYTAVTFFYSENTPTVDTSLPGREERRVVDLDTIVFTPGWITPVHAWSMTNASLAKTSEKIGGEEVRFLSLKGEGRDIFGPHNISFICEVPVAGRYQISIEAVEGPAQARVQLFRNEVAVGEAADFFAGERRKSKVVPMGVVDMAEGNNQLLFKLVGKNEKSSGLGLDLVRIICEKVE